MFKIEKLIMMGVNEKTYTYNFKEGINYLKGKNSSGKTEFYKFIDYMFGASFEIGNNPWYKGTLKKGMIEFTYNELTYRISRTMNPDINYFSYANEDNDESINLERYKDKLEAVFTIDKNTLRRLHDFSDEKLTYRTFTVFSFLGEIRQGVLADFFDKCEELKYSIKITSILNFIFNKDPEQLFVLKKELESLKKEIKELEYKESKNAFVKHKININLHKLNLGISFNGKNKEFIQKKIDDIKNMIDVKKPITSKTISELEVVHSNLDEQIKVYENRKVEMKAFQQENENRKKLLETLQDIIQVRDDFKYLIEPLISLVGELNNSISFNKYIISDETVEKLKKQRDKVKEEILMNNNKFIKYGLQDKAKAIAIIEDCFISSEKNFEDDILEKKKKRAVEVRKQIKNLSSADDEKKINEISDIVTSLYRSAVNVSDIVKQDFNDKTFNIKYFKRGNLLQTMVVRKGKDKVGREVDVDTIQPTGSLARHTLIQLCGYLAFFQLLIKENKYPIIPILVLDHISKPFDTENPKAIGAVLEKAYTMINKNDLQIFIFDDDDYTNLGIKPNHYEELVSENKTGFNPFFIQKEIDQK